MIGSLLRIAAIALIATFTPPLALAAFDCHDRTAVIYHPSKNWEKKDQYFPEHLAYITAQLASGAMLEGGPLFAGDEITGGLMIFASPDEATVRAIVATDPFIQNAAARPELRTWQACVPN